MPASTFVVGDRKQVFCAVDGTVAIAKGDLLYKTGANVFPLSNLADVGTKAQNQEAAHAVFIGVAGRAAPSGTATTIPVYTAGVFEFDTSSTTYEAGDLVGPAGTGASSAVGISNGIVEAVSYPALAIGRVYKRVPVAAVRVQVQLHTTIFAPQFIGYPPGSGVGGAVTQITSSATGVTLDKLTGQITTVALTTAVGAEEVFTVTNASVAATDVVLLGTTYAGAGTPMVTCKKVAAGSFDVVITNLHASNALNALMVLNFVVLKGAIT